MTIKNVDVRYDETNAPLCYLAVITFADGSKALRAYATEEEALSPKAARDGSGYTRDTEAPFSADEIARMTGGETQ